MVRDKKGEKLRKQAHFIAAVIITLVLIAIIVKFDVRVINGHTVLDLVQPEKGISTISEKGYITATAENLPAEIGLGEEYTVNLKLVPSANVKGSPILGVVLDSGLEIIDAPFGQFEEGGDTILYTFIPNYTNINFTVSGSSSGEYNIQSRFATFAPEDEGTFSSVLTVGEAAGDYGNCLFTDKFENFKASKYLNAQGKNIAAPVIEEGGLKLSANPYLQQNYLMEKKPYEGQEGLTFQLRIKPGDGKTRIGFINNMAPRFNANVFAYSMYFVSGRLYVYDYVWSRITPIIYNKTAWYDMKIIIRSDGGADYYFKEADAGKWSNIFSSPVAFGTYMKTYHLADSLVPGIMSATKTRIIDNWIVGQNYCSCSDSDGDHYGIGSDLAGCVSEIPDCNDASPSINPGAKDIKLNGIDEDCKNGDWDGSCEFADEFEKGYFEAENYNYNQKTGIDSPIIENIDGENMLKLSANAAYNTNYIFTKQSYAREDGLTYQIRVRPQARTGTWIGLRDASTPVHYKNFVYSIYFRYDNYGLLYENGAYKRKYFSFVPDTAYDIKIVLKEGSGANYYYKTADSDTWTTLYESSYSGVSEFVPGVMNYAGVRHIDNWKIGAEDCFVSSGPVIVCSSSSDCNDNNVSTTDSCRNPGTAASYCENTEISIACSVDSDCASGETCISPGTPGSYCQALVVIACSNNANCNDGNDCTEDTCIYPGTANSYCSNPQIPGCQTGTTCQSDADCSALYGEQYACSSGTCVNVCPTDISEYPPGYNGCRNAGGDPEFY